MLVAIPSTSNAIFFVASDDPTICNTASDTAKVPVITGETKAKLVRLPVAVPLNAGAVIVLFVSVSEPARVAKSLSERAVLNCAVVPDSVLLERLIVLLVSVSEPARVAKSLSERAVLNCAVVPVRVLLDRFRVLLVRVSEPARVERVPVVGSVRVVVAVAVSVVENAPSVVKSPASASEPTVVVTAVPPLLMTNALLANPDKVGKRANPAVTASNSDRITDDDPVDPVAGAPAWL